MAIGTILGSIFSGGAVGLLGGIGSGVFDYFKTKEANKHELAVMAAQKDLAMTAATSATLLESIKLMGASYEHDKATYEGAGWQDSVRAMIRPILVFLLTGLSIYLTWISVNNMELSGEVTNAIAQYSVFTCLDLCAMAIAWYFGNRGMEKVNRNILVSKGKPK